jgi:putative ABC transport system permease protein
MMRQERALLRLSAHGFRARLKISLVIVLGTACMTVALLPILALAEGLKLSFIASGHDDRVLVMAGSVSQRWAGSRQSASRLPVQMARIAEAAPMLAGPQSVDAEILAGVAPIKTSGEKGTARLRGLGLHGLALLPELQLVAGRAFHPGRREVMAGALAAAKFPGLRLGHAVVLAGAAWTVTGIYRSGTQLDGDLLTGAGDLKSILKRGDDNLLLVHLTRPEDFAAFKNWLAARAGMPLLIQPERDYYRDYWRAVPNTPFVVAYALGILFGGGALAGTLQATLAAAEGRAREIALLRAIGFGGRAVALSVLLEALLLGVIGAVLGTAAVWLWLDGYVYDAQGVFQITVNLHMLLIAVGWALVVAGAGAMPPVLRLARMTAAEALAAV